MKITEAILKKELLDACMDFLEEEHTPEEIMNFASEAPEKYYTNEPQGIKETIGVWLSGFFSGVMFIEGNTKYVETNEPLMEIKG